MDGCTKFAHVRNVPNQIVLELVVEHIARMLARIVERQIVVGVTVITHKKTVRLDGSVIIKGLRVLPDHSDISWSTCNSLVVMYIKKTINERFLNHLLTQST